MSDTNFAPYNPHNNQYPNPDCLNDDLPPPQMILPAKNEPQNAV